MEFLALFKVLHGQCFDQKNVTNSTNPFCESSSEKKS